jgi:hypothetical protein
MLEFLHSQVKLTVVFKSAVNGTGPIKISTIVLIIDLALNCWIS